MIARGEPMLWVTGSALVVCVIMIVALLVWVAVQGFATFWPSPVVQVTTAQGEVWMGEVAREELYQPGDSATADLPERAATRLRAELEASQGLARREMLRTGNFRLTGSHYQWMDDFSVERREEPEWAVVVERLEWGRFYGFPAAHVYLTAIEAKSRTAAREQLRALAEGTEPQPGVELQALVERDVDGSRREVLVPLEDVADVDRVVALAEVRNGREAAWRAYLDHQPRIRELWQRKRGLEDHDMGEVFERMDEARITLREAELRLEPPPPWVPAYRALREVRAEGDEEQIARLERRLQLIEDEFGQPSPEFLAAVAAAEATETAAQAEAERIAPSIHELDRELDRQALLMQTAQGQPALLRLYEIVRAYPANQLDWTGKLGVYGARWWEFLSDEPRESNKEGGVFPAIFGTVIMTLIMCLVVVPFGVLAALYLREYAKGGIIISTVRVAVNNLAGVPSIVFGVFGVGFFCYIVGSSIDELLFEARLPQPTFGTGGLMWASLTLALLTAPVVIVATEEALSAVPNSMRQGSYACGASKWQTIRRIVLPRAMPGIMTGAILAMARGAGEVAPLMLVGAVKLAPSLPVDSEFPFGANRSFMHLGFHIYDLGFQSQNSEAAKPMVYTTTLLLITLIALLNLAAIWLRKRLHRKFVGGHF
ncbi:MAG: phosphate ABC transporter permease PstA [Planctomycetota bacterium]